MTTTHRKAIMWTALVLLITTAASLVYFGALDKLVIARMRYLTQHWSKEWGNHWMGIIIEQYPNDLMSYQQIVWDIKPDIIIETGTYMGGLTYYLANVLETIDPDARIITVDKFPEDGWYQTEKYIVGKPGLEKLRKKIDFIAGDSVGPETIARIKELLGKAKERLGRDLKVVVILDSWHAKSHVLNELRAYEQFVSKDSYLIVNDTHLTKVKINETDYEDGPLYAIHEFLPTTSKFKIDKERERYYITCNQSGFLKRVE